jgi:hypothetical protein
VHAGAVGATSPRGQAWAILGPSSRRVMPPTASQATSSPRDERRRRRGSVKVAVAVVVVLLGLGIGALVVVSGDHNSDDPGALGGPDGTKPKTEAEKVEEAYRNYWAANFKAGAIPDPSDPSLAAYATGQQLQAAVSDLEKLRRDGVATRTVAGSVARRQVTVSSVSGDRARLQDCAVDDSILVRADTGKPAFDYTGSPAATTLFSADLVKEHGAWKVEALRRDRRWEGIAGCAIGQS